MSSLLDDKVAVVTGSSRGLGRAIAIALAVDGAKVVVASRDGGKARDVTAAIEGLGASACPCVVDVTEPAAADRIVDEAVARYGRLDIVVNSAGLFVWKPFLEITPEEWARVLATNLGAAFLLTQKAAAVMIDAGRGGSIVNITSIHGTIADPNVVPQCASKFGLVGLTRSTAEALREHDIRVNAIAPGSIEPDSADRRGESPRQKITQADVASLVVYLASDLSRALTGAVIDAWGSTHTVIEV